MILFSYSAEQYDLSISATGVPNVGEEYNLTCRVNLSAGTPSIQWQYHNGNEVTTGGDITVGSLETAGTTVTTLILTFNPLQTSHGGEYICRSVVEGTVERTTMENVTVQSEPVNCCTSRARLMDNTIPPTSGLVCMASYHRFLVGSPTHCCILWWS